jgi:hypothetical protein
VTDADAIAWLWDLVRQPDERDDDLIARVQAASGRHRAASSRGGIKVAIASVPGCCAVSFDEDPERHAFEVEIEGPTMAAVRAAAAIAEERIAAGVAFSWIPAGEAARELKRESITDPDWRPATIMPEDFYAK